jgi:uncharacterized coiled-coil DUF342 family protein
MATNDYAERPDVLAYRVKQAGDEIKSLNVWRREVEAELVRNREQVGAMRADIQDLTDGFNSLRRTLLAFAFTIAGSAVVFALAILAATGKV